MLVRRPRRTARASAIENVFRARCARFADAARGGEASTSGKMPEKDGVVDVEGAKARARARAEMLKDEELASKVRAMMVFDRDVVRAHRDRAAYLQNEALKRRPERAPDGLLDELARRLLDRLFDIKRGFKRVVVLGGASEAITRRLLAERDDVEKIVVVDLSQDMLNLLPLKLQRDSDSNHDV